MSQQLRGLFSQVTPDVFLVWDSSPHDWAEAEPRLKIASLGRELEIGLLEALRYHARNL